MVQQKAKAVKKSEQVKIAASSTTSNPTIMPAPHRIPGFLVYPGSGGSSSLYPPPRSSIAIPTNFSPLMQMLNQDTFGVGNNKTPQLPICPLCKNPMVDLRILPCEHHFHRICLERSLIIRMAYKNGAPTVPIESKISEESKHPECPICKTQIKQQQRIGIPLSSSPSIQMLQPNPQSKSGAAMDPNTLGLRRGKWTKEEEDYVQGLIEEFQMGVLPLKDGTTLRNFLAQLLHCDPMRISKKFVGSQCVGKKVYRNKPDAVEARSAEDKQQSRRRLAELEFKFLEKIKSMAKKKRKRKPKVDSAATTTPVRIENVKTETKNTQEIKPASTTKHSHKSHRKEISASQESKQRGDTSAVEEFPRVSSTDSFLASFPRVESLEGLFGFPRVASFDNMMGGIGRSTSSESFSSVLPRVSSLEQLSNLAAAESAITVDSQKKSTNGHNDKPPPQLPINIKPELPKVPSFEKSLSHHADTKDTNSRRIPSSERLFLPTSLSSLAGFSENGGISREPSYHNLAGSGADYAVGFGLSMSRPISSDKLSAMTIDNVNGRNSAEAKAEPSDSSIPRISSIEDILAMVNNSQSNKEKGSPKAAPSNTDE